MRFLFVYQDYARQAKEILVREAAKDVRLVVVGKHDVRPSESDELSMRSHPSSPAAVCGVVKRFRKSIDDLVDIQYCPNQFRAEDRQLISWLRPELAAEIGEARPPSEICRRTREEVPLLRFARGAYDRSDDLAKVRWAFIEKSMLLLRRLAVGEELGPARLWLATHGVDFAVNGKVCYVFGAPDGTRKTSEWHLKSGDHTDAVAAARVYFCSMEMEGVRFVVVTYLGPHPPDGRHEVFVDL